MRFLVRTSLAFGRLQRRYRVGRDRGLYEVSGLIRRQARQSLRVRKSASKPGTPPSAHTSGGLREINFAVHGQSSTIGPRKFSGSNFLSKPVPHVHEKGATVVVSSIKGRFLRTYPERSFMWRAVKTLNSNNKLQERFTYTLRNTW